jgi:hypothetical protein
MLVHSRSPFVFCDASPCCRMQGRSILTAEAQRPQRFRRATASERVFLRVLCVFAVKARDTPALLQDARQDDSEPDGEEAGEQAAERIGEGPDPGRGFHEG